MDDELITPQQVNSRVARIADLALRRDNEVAHKEEDDLLMDVLRAIARGNPDPVGLARAAVTLGEYHYDKWYA